MPCGRPPTSRRAPSAASRPCGVGWKGCVGDSAELGGARMTRRDLLGWSARVTAALAWTGALGALAPAAAAPSPTAAVSPRTGGEPAGDAVTAARGDLRRLVVGRALATDDPWVLMHAMLPLGPDARHGGELVLDYVARSWLELVPAGGTSY